MKNCPNCGKVLTSRDYDSYYDTEIEDTVLFVYCSNCEYDERETDALDYSVRDTTTPCDYGPCPYDAEYSEHCRIYCGLGVDE